MFPVENLLSQIMEQKFKYPLLLQQQQQKPNGGYWDCLTAIDKPAKPVMPSLSTPLATGKPKMPIMGKLNLGAIPPKEEETKEPVKKMGLSLGTDKIAAANNLKKVSSLEELEDYNDNK